MDDRPIRTEFFLDEAAVAVAKFNPDAFNRDQIWGVVLDRYGPVIDLRSYTLALDPGDAASPLLPDGARGGWLLDLDPSDWRSEWGGMLLFQGETQQVQGYRPVPGALTMFLASTRPLISFITPQGARRTSVFGWWS